MPEVADRFLDAIEAAFDQILRMPKIGAPRLLSNRTLAGLRCWHVRGFKDILIFYIVTGEKLRVIRVLHGKREISRILERETNDDDG